MSVDQRIRNIEHGKAVFAHPLEKFRACLPPEALEPSGSDACVVDGVLGVAMAEVILD